MLGTEAVPVRETLSQLPKWDPSSWGSSAQGLKTRVRQGPPAPVVGKVPEPGSDQRAGTSLWLQDGLGASGEVSIFCWPPTEKGHVFCSVFCLFLAIECMSSTTYLYILGLDALSDSGRQRLLLFHRMPFWLFTLLCKSFLA